MTKDLLEAGNKLNLELEFHKSEYGAFEQKITELKEMKNKLFLKGSKVKNMYVGYGFGHNNSFGNINIRTDHLITVLKVEAQYHFQEMKKYERELERLKE